MTHAVRLPDTDPGQQPDDASTAPSVATGPDPITPTLADVVSGPGPFCTAYLRRGPMLTDLFDELAGDDPSPAAAHVREALRRHEADDTPVGATIAVVASAETAHLACFDAPIRDDVVRVGPVSSLGTWLEFLQMAPVHLVVTTDGDEVVLHEVRPEPDTATARTIASGSIEAMASAARFRRPDLTTVIAPADRHDDLGAVFDEIAGGFGLHLRSDHAPVDELADELVRLADDHRARRITGALVAWREADRLGLTACGGEAINSLIRGDATLLIVHDDPDDERRHGDRRLVDDAVHRALLAGVATVVVPDVAEGRGPIGGLGTILRTAAG